MTSDFNIRALINKNAYTQAIDAGASPAAAKVLAHLAENVEWRVNAAVELLPRQVRRAQTKIGEKLGMHYKTVHKAIRDLQKRGLLIDHDHDLRNCPHRYEVTLDWSFSQVLMAIPGFQGSDETEPVAHSYRSEPAPEQRYPKLRRQGQGQTNFKPGTCNVCHVEVAVGAGSIWKFQTIHLLFCRLHSMFGKAAAHANWPESEPFPEGSAYLQRLQEGWNMGLRGKPSYQ